jgi:hypothetical protein
VATSKGKGKIALFLNNYPGRRLYCLILIGDDGILTLGVFGNTSYHTSFTAYAIFFVEI